MIVFCGIPSEAPLQAAIAAADQRGHDYLVFNQREAHVADVSFDFRAGAVDGAMRFRGRTVESAQVDGVYVRMMDIDDLPEHRRRRPWGTEVEVRRSREAHTAFLEWLNVAPCRVLNRPGHALSNMSKVYQAYAIKRCGFLVPATIITNHPRAVRRFVATKRRVVFKSASGQRSIVEELTAERMKNLELVRNLPTQFQEYIDGTNVRVHTVGHRCFATEIVSEAVDYRYTARSGLSATLRECALPLEVAERCVELAHALGLPFAGIDLKRTPQDEYYCFEVNPSPAYTYYEEQTGQRIAEAVVDYLAQGG